VANHSHNACNFVCSVDTSKLTLLAHQGWESILIRLIDCRLMKADGRGMYIHVREDNIWIGQAIREL
jgi:hypothetical protein